MKASEARKISEAFEVDNRYVQHVLEQIYAKIKEKANIGQFDLVHVFYGIDWGSETVKYRSNIEKAVIKQLRQDGYEYIHHDNPDPGDPRSTSFDELKW